MGSEGYLINQFIAAQTNKRHDKWGGDFPHRAQFPVEIIKRMRAAVGNDFIIIYRLRYTYTHVHLLYTVQSIAHSSHVLRQHHSSHVLRQQCQLMIHCATLSYISTASVVIYQ
jgi:2,4-dienoyl-CoA reductase-like NADH-dependent reductase (Old Yellow Enzyme family)